MRRLLIIGLTLIGLQAYSQEVRWENITVLHYAATGGSDLEHTLQQYLLLDLEAAIGREVDLVEYRSLKPFAVQSAERDKYLIYER